MENQTPTPDIKSTSGVKAAAADKTKKAIWALPGALATIGGIVGLYQFILSPNSSVSVAERTQTELLEMVSSGKMTAKEAQAFAQTLKDLNSNDSAETELPVKAEGTPSDITKTAAELAASDDPKKRMAIVLIADKKTRKDGIEMLESTATTSDDWFDVAELSWGWDNERTLAAARKAVALDPSNYAALSLLASAQIADNQFKDARKTAMAIMVVAETDAEKITAYSTLSHPQQALGDLEGLKDTAENLTALLASHKEKSTFNPSEYNEDTAEDSPTYTQFDGYSHLGSVNFLMGDFEAGLKAYDTAGEYIQNLIDAIPESSDLRFRLVQVHQVKASTYFRMQNFADGLNEVETALEIVRDMAERGVPRSKEYLPNAYGGVASLQTYLENYPKAGVAFKKMGDLLLSQNGLATENKDEWLAYVNARMGEANALAKMGQMGEGSKIVEDFIAQSEANAATHPDDLWRYSALTQTSWYASYYYQDQGDLEKAVSYAKRPAKFLKSVERTDHNRDAIERAMLALTVNEADLYHRADQTKKSETIYRAALKELKASAKENDKANEPILNAGVLHQRLASLGLDDAKDHEAKAFEIFDKLNSMAKLPLEYQETYMAMLKAREE